MHHPDSRYNSKSKKYSKSKNIFKRYKIIILLYQETFDIPVTIPSFVKILKCSIISIISNFSHKNKYGIKLFSSFFFPNYPWIIHPPETSKCKLQCIEKNRSDLPRRDFVALREEIVDVRHTSAPRNANEYVIVRTGAICVIQSYHICPRIPALPSILAKTSCNQETSPISFCTLTLDRTIHLFCLKYSFALSHLTNRWHSR